jgi:hypothetical protein
MARIPKRTNLSLTYFCGGRPLETNNRQKANKTPDLVVFLILVFLLGVGLVGCGGWSLEFDTPNVPPAPCRIEELLIDVSDLPGDTWQEIGSPSDRDAPVRMGVEKTGTMFSGTFDFILQQVYRFESDRQANNAYEEEVGVWFKPSTHHTEYAKPQELDNLVVNTDQYQVGCNDLKSGGREQCQFVASYGAYIIRLLGGMRDLSYEDVIELVNEIDQRATSCLAQ